MAAGLTVNDRLYLYSDGVPEACSPAGEQFGEARFLEAIEASAGAPLNESLALIEKQLEDWCGAAGFKDDVPCWPWRFSRPRVAYPLRVARYFEGVLFMTITSETRDGLAVAHLSGSLDSPAGKHFRESPRN